MESWTSTSLNKFGTPACEATQNQRGWSLSLVLSYFSLVCFEMCKISQTKPICHSQSSFLALGQSYPSYPFHALHVLATYKDVGTVLSNRV